MWPWLAAAAWSTEPPVEMELGESALEEPAIEPVPEALAGVVGPHLPAAVADPPPARASLPVTLPSVPPEIAGLWPLAVAGVGAGLVLVGRRRQQRAPAELRIISRTPVNGQTALLLVDVQDAAGREHRLLVGTGGGPPSLVADLGVAHDDEEEAAELAAPVAYEAPRITASAPRPRKAAAQALISEVVEERRIAMVHP